METGLMAIAQAKEDGQTVEYYLRDLNTWENEMKQKEAALKNEQAQQALPPVRTRQRREKYMKSKKKNTRKRPATTDYQAWEEFDPNKAYEEMENVGPLTLTLDLKQSAVIKQMQLREEAHHEKERGNRFVKAERWDDAIACYNRAIQLVKDDAIYYANRGLCYLKKDSLHQAEQDCTEALRLDPKYVKALIRRATARERLGSLRAACTDLTLVMTLEPHNIAAKQQLEGIKQRMGTKGKKAKSSPAVANKTPSSDASNFTTQLCTPPAPKPQEPQEPQVVQENPPESSLSSKVGQKTPQVPPGKIFGVPQASQIKLDIEPTPIKMVDNGSSVECWREGVDENVCVIKPVKKPPHLRSKRALKTIPIREIPLGKTIEDAEKPATRMKIFEIDQCQGDTNNNDDQQTDKTVDVSLNSDVKINTVQDIDLYKNETNENVKIASNDVNIEFNDVKIKSNDIEIKSNNVKIEANDVAVEPNDLKKESNIKKIESNDVKMESSDVKMESNDGNIESDVMMKSTDVKMESNGVEIESNNVKMESKLLKVSKNDIVAPVNSVQFMFGWRNLRGDDSARCDYLSLLEPTTIPKVFANALESAVLSEIIQVLHNYKNTFRPRVNDYLKGLARVKRLSALVMFLSADDKELLNKLLVHCKTAENCSDEDIAELKIKYEL